MATSKASTTRFLSQCYRESYYQFFLAMWSTIAAERLVDSWYIKKLCDELQELSERVFNDQPKLYDLFWNCPPGTSKSSVVSILWQPWIWTRMPSARFISGSYSERIALDLSRKSRDCVLSDQYRQLFPEVELRSDQSAKSYFANTAGGFRYAVGIGGSVTGMHAHFIAIDDPIDPLGALSDLVLAESNAWMTETLPSRKVHRMLTPSVTIMQRLHQNDPTGAAVDKAVIACEKRGIVATVTSPDLELVGKIRMRVVPADTSWEVVPPDWKSHYNEDGLLDSSRLPKQALEDAERELGEIGYAGQYGQCLVAGTMIQTKRGLICIESVLVGDLVATRNGWKRVIWSGKTQEAHQVCLCSVLFGNGSIVCGTQDHPIWTESGDWICLDALSGVEYNRVFAQHQEEIWEDREQTLQTQSNSMGLSILEGGDIPISGIGSGVQRREERSSDISTEISGSSTLVTFPTASISITRTKTQITIQLIILNASLRASIRSGTPETILNIESFLQGYVLSALVGIQRISDGSFIENMGGSALQGCGSKLSILFILVLPAEQSSDQGQSERRSSVLVNAKIEAESDPIERFAATVRQTLLLAIPEQSAALDPVRQKCGDVPVYDLTVEDAHEYYANGILVHNCPSPRGGAMFKVDRLLFAPTPPEKWKSGPVRYWDKAATAKSGCYTVGCKMAVDTDDKVWILDIARGQWDSGTRERQILATAVMDGKKIRQIVEQEPAGSGLESAESTIKRLTLAGYRCIADKPSGDKELRADPLSQHVNMGNVVLLTGHWNRVFVEELRFFPRSKYKDQVDAASGGFAMLVKKRLKIGVLTSGK